MLHISIFWSFAFSDANIITELALSTLINGANLLHNHG